MTLLAEEATIEAKAKEALGKPGEGVVVRGAKGLKEKARVLIVASRDI